MSWTHIHKNLGMGLEEQWIFRPGVAPICSLKKSADGNTWDASLLALTGISSTRIVISMQWGLEQAKRICEVTLREMGWDWKGRTTRGNEVKVEDR